MNRFIAGFLLSTVLVPCTARTIDIAAIDSFITHIERHNQGIGSVAVSHRGKIIYSRAFNRSAVASDNGKYRIGSITKLFTAILIHRLCSENRLSLDTTLDNFYPHFSTADHITIRQMLSHTSGLGDYLVKQDTLPVWLVSPVGEQAILDEIIRQDVRFSPDSDTRYSNTAYYLLGRIVERFYRKPFPQVVAEQILRPLRLDHTAAGLSDPHAAATPYRLNTANRWQEVTDLYFPNVKAVGDMVSTPHDLIRLIEALFAGNIVEPRSLEAMMPAEKEAFGCGLMRMPFYDKTFYGHAGDTYGTNTVIMYNPDDSIGIALCINGCSTPRNTLLIGIASAIYETDFDYPDFSQLQRYAAPTDSLCAYAGTFRSTAFTLPIILKCNAGNLSLEIPGQPASWLESKSPDIFVNTPTGVGIAFKGKDRLAFRQHGKLLIFTRSDTVKDSR